MDNGETCSFISRLWRVTSDFTSLVTKALRNVISKALKDSLRQEIVRKHNELLDRALGPMHINLCATAVHTLSYILMSTADMSAPQIILPPSLSLVTKGILYSAKYVTK